ncbi:hypothetical protein RRG08_042213 [Elysia crispata]|uniref:Uncharacterized protein n=1 Tax=Elysia crispata TaxID=231223 RepID=A0AAE1EBY0_9GAST|nr:hypothetical protein RRG08_042213 [Elysia crispata]
MKDEAFLTDVGDHCAVDMKDEAFLIDVDTERIVCGMTSAAGSLFLLPPHPSTHPTHLFLLLLLFYKQHSLWHLHGYCENFLITITVERKIKKILVFDGSTRSGKEFVAPQRLDWDSTVVNCPRKEASSPQQLTRNDFSGKKHFSKLAEDVIRHFSLCFTRNLRKVTHKDFQENGRKSLLDISRVIVLAARYDRVNCPCCIFSPQ